MSKTTLETDAATEVQRLHDRISEAKKESHKDWVDMRDTMEARFDKMEERLIGEINEAKTAISDHETACAEDRLIREKRFGDIESDGKATRLRVNILCWVTGTVGTAMIAWIVEYFFNLV